MKFRQTAHKTAAAVCACAGSTSRHAAPDVVGAITTASHTPSNTGTQPPQKRREREGAATLSEDERDARAAGHGLVGTYQNLCQRHLFACACSSRSMLTAEWVSLTCQQPGTATTQRLATCHKGHLSGPAMHAWPHPYTHTCLHYQPAAVMCWLLPSRRMASRPAPWRPPWCRQQPHMHAAAGKVRGAAAGVFGGGSGRSSGGGRSSNRA